jgi:catechol 2,3-dioxygenase-like lactoylglutathione lyase family enzyme
MSRDLAIPILPSRSPAATLRFYARLGFTGELRANGTYAILTRGDLEVHVAEHRTLVPAESYGQCYLRVEDVDAVHRAMRSAALPVAGIPRMDLVTDKPWGMREFAVVDEDGNLLRIGQPL